MFQKSIHIKIILLFTVIFVLLMLTIAIAIAGSGFINGWTLTAPLPEPVAGPQVVAVNGVLYSIGGQNVTAPTAKIFSAVIQDGDGAIPQWKEVSSALPKALYLHTVINTGNRIFSIGGYDGKLRYSSVYSSTVISNSELSEWTIVNDLPRKLVLHSAVVTRNAENSGDCIFVLGGWGEEEKALASVFSLAINTNSTSLWQEMKPLPEPRFRAIAASYQNSVTQQSFVYLLGGFDGKETRSEIYVTKLKNGCEIEEWQKTKQLARAVHYHAVIQYGDRLIVFGGKNDVEPINSVFSAPIFADGNLGEWEKESDIPVTLYRFAAVTTNPATDNQTFLYVLGGMHDKFYQSQVYRTTLPNLRPSETPTPTAPPVPSATPTATVQPTATPSPTPTSGFTTLLLLAEPTTEVLQGETITYTVHYSNGAQTLEQVLLFNSLPVNTQLLSAPNGCVNNVQELVCHLSDTMPAFTSDSITYTVQVLSTPIQQQIIAGATPLEVHQENPVVNQGACIKWRFQREDSIQCSNAVSTPPQQIFLPLITN